MFVNSKGSSRQWGCPLYTKRLTRNGMGLESWTPKRSNFTSHILPYSPQKQNRSRQVSETPQCVVKCLETFQECFVKIAADIHIITTSLTEFIASGLYRHEGVREEIGTTLWFPSRSRKGGRLLVRVHVPARRLVLISKLVQLHVVVGKWLTQESNLWSKPPTRERYDWLFLCLPRRTD